MPCRRRIYRATTSSAVAHVRDRPCSAANAFMKRNIRVAYLPYVPTAVVLAVLTNTINIMSPKHERQRQQTWRPCDHHSQQEPLIGLHCSVRFSHSLAGSPPLQGQA